METERKHNIDNINLVIDYLEGRKMLMFEGERVYYNQRVWFHRVGSLRYGTAEYGSINGYKFQRHCGTAACIAGFVILALEPETMNMYDDGRLSSSYIQCRAAELLGLGEWESAQLFEGCPIPLHQRAKVNTYFVGDRADTPHAIQAARVLKWLRDTGEVDWSVAEEINNDQLEEANNG